MKKNKSTIILILVFFVGLSVMLYPTISDYVNQLHQTRAVANYAADVDKLSDADYTAYFEAADAFNAQIAADPDALYFPDRFPSYESTLDVTGTGIMGYITIEKIGVELPIYHGTSDAVLQVAAGHLEGTSLPVGGASTHAVISAHRGLPSAKLFTNLDQLEVGDTFTITRSRVSSLTRGLPCSAFEAVAKDTLASAATPFRFRFGLKVSCALLWSACCARGFSYAMEKRRLLTSLVYAL